ncbi:Uncharacterised protein [Staphylococcus aureus]|nr:Uncharacterised protein [Staphylococcus aureus]
MRYYQAFSKCDHVIHPLSAETQADTLLYKQEHTKNEQMYMLVAQFSKNEITYEKFIEGMGELQ